MATVTQKRRRLYVLIGLIFVSSYFYYMSHRDATPSLLDQYPILMDTQEKIFHETKVSIQPLLSASQNGLCFIFTIESYHYPNLINDQLYENILITMQDDLVEDTAWNVLEQSEYRLKGTITFENKDLIDFPLTFHLFFIDEQVFEWEST